MRMHDIVHRTRIPCTCLAPLSGWGGLFASTQASDVAISQFSFLVPLLFCHGRRAYRRMAVTSLASGKVSCGHSYFDTCFPSPPNRKTSGNLPKNDSGEIRKTTKKMRNVPRIPGFRRWHSSQISHSVGFVRDKRCEKTSRRRPWSAGLMLDVYRRRTSDS